MRTTVTLDKDVTLRGPMPDWNTPGTHMGFIQAAATAPTSTCTGSRARAGPSA